jgi:hypothetical protein
MDPTNSKFVQILYGLPNEWFKVGGGTIIAVKELKGKLSAQ